MSLGLDNYRHRKVITVVGGLLLLSLIITITVEFVVMSTMIYFMLSCNVRLSCSLPPPPPPRGAGTGKAFNLDDGTNLNLTGFES